MKYAFFIVVIVSLSFGNVTHKLNFSEDLTSETSHDSLKVVDFNGLEKYLSRKDPNKTYVVNFWATWCAPCVKELPYFEQLNAEYSDNQVEVVLVSLDFPRQIESKLKPFLKKKGVKSEVVVLNDVDSNTWIPKVDENWSGAIPATIIYNKKRKVFYERSFNYQELETELQQFIKIE
ncbi:thioredoxin [Flavobacteriales bacterium 33_180_T64]|nr:thioredoxin [Flavobacteriales bacterium 33_180_T64]